MLEDVLTIQMNQCKPVDISDYEWEYLFEKYNNNSKQELFSDHGVYDMETTVNEHMGISLYHLLYLA